MGVDVDPCNEAAVLMGTSSHTDATVLEATEGDLSVVCLSMSACLSTRPPAFPPESDRVSFSPCLHSSAARGRASASLPAACPSGVPAAEGPHSPGTQGAQPQPQLWPISFSPSRLEAGFNRLLKARNHFLGLQSV